MTEKPLEDMDLSREVEEIPQGIYDDGREIVTRQITPKAKAPVVSQKKGLSKRVLWTIVSIIGFGLAGISLALTLAASQTS
jgi:hypothetical protein